MTDNVNHPAHYETGKFECIEVMLETQGVEAVLNFCQCNALRKSAVFTDRRVTYDTGRTY